MDKVTYEELCGDLLAARIAITQAIIDAEGVGDHALALARTNRARRIVESELDNVRYLVGAAWMRRQASIN